MKQPIKIIIEVQGGLVQAVYAGSPANRLIEAVVVDHDVACVGDDVPVQPLRDFDFAETRAYDGGFSPGWHDLMPTAK